MHCDEEVSWPMLPAEMIYKATLWFRSVQLIISEQSLPIGFLFSFFFSQSFHFLPSVT